MEFRAGALEDVERLMLDLSAYDGAKVLVTGHTGFKGSWLCEMLLLAGAEVHGYALQPPTRPALFRQLKLSKRMASHTIGDVRDIASLADTVERVLPDFVFHLAAQPLVRISYQSPVETFDANVMGTVNLLDAVRTACTSKRGRRRHAGRPCAVVCITTDKCYENDDSGRAFKESDPLGGADPYSASKGACEIAIASYRRSFFSAEDSMVRVASARAGNVVGGGDWALDRIVPDAMRAFLSGGELAVRNCRSTRPWQHVLEPLTGYLMLGKALCEGQKYAQAFNFGPDRRTVRTVGDLVNELIKSFPNAHVVDRTSPGAPREARLLTLDSTKAAKVLGWVPKWGFPKTVRMTAEWYKSVAEGGDARAVTDRQIWEFLRQ